ncbi:uncharacterized protein LOC111032012 [Myzus persicae]|uniref:uncharacterized protein LOC111032012 n=1 Tax=Myzus persicae TaxID=13164 RepID=UPI000B93776E|nr:uncharacterized protein LOC111032012 [Myzus persicae]
MITINRPVASIVAAADECIQFLITGRRNGGKQDATPSVGRFGIVRLVVKFSGEIFQWDCRTGHQHRTRRPRANAIESVHFLFLPTDTSLFHQKRVFPFSTRRGDSDNTFPPERPEQSFKFLLFKAGIQFLVY